MKKFMKKMWEKKNSKKGFTLVELIVVLVILAILMAIMVPAMTGWIDKARDKQIMLDARNVELAAQAGLYEAYGKESDGALAEATDTAVSGNTYVGDYVDSVCGDEWSDGVTCTISYGTDGVIDKFVYTKSEKTVTYTPSAGWVMGS